jgi:DNA mismatch repair ATPase MutS
MILDSQAIEHLELLKVTSASKDVKATLFDYIDHCKTAFGKRLLKKWLLSPLTDISRIEERLDSIEDLISCPHEASNLQSKLSKLPDLEKIMSKVFTYSVRT